MRLTLLSLPLLALASSQVVWNTGDGTKYAGVFNDDIGWCHNETSTSAIVSEGVCCLCTGVFEYCTKLETVSLPESLRKIGNQTFHYCKALVHVDIPSGVNKIGEGAFAHSSLETVTIPEGVVDLPDGIFFQCESLKSAKLSSSLKTIGMSAFQYCSALMTIKPDALEGLTEIGEKAFHGCSITSAPPPIMNAVSENFVP